MCPRMSNSGITEGDRSVWVAYWEEGRTEAEIAATLNRSVNAISVRILLCLL